MIMGDLADDDRKNGMGIVVEYAGHKTAMDAGEAISLGLHAIWNERSGCARNDRHAVCEIQCRRSRVQSLDH